MVDISSNSLVELQLFLDALSRIEDPVTLAIQVYDAAGADTHLKIKLIENSPYIVDDEAKNVPLVHARWSQITGLGDQRSPSPARSATQYRTSEHELKSDPQIPLLIQPTNASNPVRAGTTAAEQGGEFDEASHPEMKVRAADLKAPHCPRKRSGVQPEKGHAPAIRESLSIK